MLERLFTSRSRIKILKFLFFEKEESYLREIARKLKISPSNVKKEIENMEKIGLIEINERKISINKECSFIEDLMNIFIKTDFAGYPILEALKREDIKFIFIFGSFAKGDYSAESDIDLGIIGNVKREKIYSLLRNVQKNLKREINPIVWTFDKFKGEKESSFIRDILKKGIMMIKGGKNEFRKIIKRKEN